MPCNSHKIINNNDESAQSISRNSLQQGPSLIVIREDKNVGQYRQITDKWTRRKASWGWAKWNGMLTELNCIVGKTFHLHLILGSPGLLPTSNRLLRNVIKGGGVGRTFIDRRGIHSSLFGENMQLSLPNSFEMSSGSRQDQEKNLQRRRLIKI